MNNGLNGLSWLPQERLLYRELVEQVQSGEPLVRATIVRSWGSTPREVGAKMLVLHGGGIRGTVGGGCGEAEVWQAAQSVLQNGQARCVHVDLTDDLDSDAGKVCGGRFDVFLELWTRDSRLELLEPLSLALHEDRDLALLTYLGPHGQSTWKKTEAVLAPPLLPLGATMACDGAGRWVGTVGPWRAVLEDTTRRALLHGGCKVWKVDWDGGSHDFFFDVLARPLELVIAGAGHIARPLCEMASLCGYRVTVIDDRPEYADPVYFPRAHAVICRDFREAFASLSYHARSHIVLVTRGHKHDEECLRQAIDKPLAYLGMIGSRRRTRAVFEQLESEGLQPQWLDRIHAPIGLDIGAETPEEIAVCILGEMIQVRRGGGAGQKSLRKKEIENFLR